jgi:hypothetical protein
MSQARSPNVKIDLAGFEFLPTKRRSRQVVRRRKFRNAAEQKQK